MASHVTADDVGKPVVYENDVIGRVVAYEDGEAFVDPDPGITDYLWSKLRAETAPDDAFPLHRDIVRRVTEEAVVLEHEL